MLTVRTVQTVGDGWHHDEHGLYLQVTSNGGGRSWAYRYSVGGKQRYIGLGPAHAINLKTARELARQCREMRVRGIDPLQAKRDRQNESRLAEAKQRTFGQCVESFLQFKRPEWSNPKHAEQWEMTLRKYAKPLHPFSPDAIDLTLVVKTLQPIWTEIPETASRTRQRIEAVLDHWAATNEVHGYSNPAAWDRVKHALPSVAKIKKGSHHPALPYERMGEFMQALRSHDGIAARALEFLILTAARTGDVIGQERDDKPPMLWKHVDLTKRLWTIPSTKTETEHQVPLSDAALAVLREMKAHGNPNEPVFPGLRHGESMSNMTIAKVIKQMNRGGPFWVDPKQGDRPVVPHGFRSSFRDWAAEQTNFPREIAEAALAHVLESKTEAAYRRSDLLEKRRRLMAAWGQYCAKATISAGVIPLHQRG